MQKTAALEGKFCAEGRSRAATITRARAKRKKAAAAAAARVYSQLHITYCLKKVKEQTVVSYLKIIILIIFLPEELHPEHLLEPLHPEHLLELLHPEHLLGALLLEYLQALLHLEHPLELLHPEYPLVLLELLPRENPLRSGLELPVKQFGTFETPVRLKIGPEGATGYALGPRILIGSFLTLHRAIYYSTHYTHPILYKPFNAITKALLGHQVFLKVIFIRCSTRMQTKFTLQPMSVKNIIDSRMMHYRASAHQKTVHEGRKDYPCNKCEKKFGQKSYLLDHQKTIHECHKYYACDNCDKKFGFQSNLTRHRKMVHEGRKDFVCDGCKKKFGLKTDLLNHQRAIHEGRKDFACDECEKKFGKKSNLLCHQRTVHEGRKDFTCDICEKKFGQKMQLIRHQHTEHDCRKEHACDNCEKRFGLKADLIRHQKIVHEGLKDCSCDKCEKKFVEKSNLLYHERTIHEGRKDFKCDYCDKKFGNQGNLTRHRKMVHEGLKDYECDICDKKFGEKWILFQHQKTVHEGQNRSCIYKRKQRWVTWVTRPIMFPSIRRSLTNIPTSFPELKIASKSSFDQFGYLGYLGYSANNAPSTLLHLFVHCCHLTRHHVVLISTTLLPIFRQRQFLNNASGAASMVRLIWNCSCQQTQCFESVQCGKQNLIHLHTNQAFLHQFLLNHVWICINTEPFQNRLVLIGHHLQPKFLLCCPMLSSDSVTPAPINTSTGLGFCLTRANFNTAEHRKILTAQGNHNVRCNYVVDIEFDTTSIYRRNTCTDTKEQRASSKIGSYFSPGHRYPECAPGMKLCGLGAARFWVDGARVAAANVSSVIYISIYARYRYAAGGASAPRCRRAAANTYNHDDDEARRRRRREQHAAHQGNTSRALYTYSPASLEASCVLCPMCSIP
ncbi:unnamed protein product [Trichogramma brassicae]|uniref:C2H2-type domain-containing protein n=1 Tax=Trichogramma brassicae TaxID=86971 RepID=A0A6H5I4K9_9HYME|nr:unnamed protein product [Trichogramma brassicae]